MANTLDVNEFLPHPASLTASDVVKDSEGWLIETAASNHAACPDCGVLSTSRHSSYLRTLADLPMQGLAVRVKIRVSRWRCRNGRCRRQIFCQRLDQVTHRHGRETDRCRGVVQQVAHALGGRPAERLMTCLGIRRSRHTLLRAIKRRAESSVPLQSIAVVGVDDWAWRKGCNSYGTILVDLEQGVVADLLPDRSAASFATWLREHPGVRIISRDRDGIYAEGGRAGAATAKQVADRFHLIQNLSKAVQDGLAHQRDRLLIPVQEFVHNTAPVKATLPVPEIMQPPRQQEKDAIRQLRWQHQVQLFEIVKGLHVQGLRASDIVRQTGLSRGRVDKWLRLEKCPPRSRKTPLPGMAEDFRGALLRLWKRGCHKGADLLIRIRRLGYIGSLTSLNRFLTPWRAAKRAAKRANRLDAGPIDHSSPATSAMRHISPQEAAALLGKPKPMLTERQSQIVEFLKRTPEFARMRRLLLSFRTILCRGKVSSLRRWARQAKAAGIAPISRFVRQLKKDWNAVENAVTQMWSNGPTEDHINRLKMLKRQMYGRAGVELLRARLLPCPPSQLHQI